MTIRQRFAMLHAHLIRSTTVNVVGVLAGLALATAPIWLQWL